MSKLFNVLYYSLSKVTIQYLKVILFFKLIVEILNFNRFFTENKILHIILD